MIRAKHFPVCLMVFAVLGAASLQTYASVYPTALVSEFKRAAGDGDPTAQLHCLALNVYHEARGEPEAGKFAVAAVTLNRVRSPRFPNTVCRVVWQRGQFSWTKDGRPDRPYDYPAWATALWVATLTYYGLAHDAPVGNATYFHAIHVRPFWARHKRRIGRVGGHIFYASS